MVILISDTRERAVHPFLNCRIEQINVGDYIIQNDNVLACFERKTLVDYSNSIKEGRINNMKKMIKLREVCQLFLIIENKSVFVNDDRKFAGIKFLNIRKSIQHYIIRDKINVIYTKDPKHTAEILEEYLEYFNELYPSSSPIKDIKCIGKYKISDEEYAAKILSAIPGISFNTAKLLICKYSIDSLFKMSMQELDDLSVKITKRGKIGLIEKDKHGLKILSNSVGFSKNTSLQLLQMISFTQFLNLPLEEKEKITINKRRLLKKARDFNFYINFTRCA